MVEVLILSLVVTSLTGEGQPQSAQPGIKLAEVLAREGSLITTRSIGLGEVNGTTGSVEIEAIAAWEVGKEKVVTKGARITVRERSPQSLTVALLDYDEISGLIKAIDHMKRIIASVKAPPPAATSKPQAREETTVVFRTRGSFSLTVSGGPNGFLATCTIKDIPTVSASFASTRLDEFQSIARSALLAVESW